MQVTIGICAGEEVEKTVVFGASEGGVGEDNEVSHYDAICVYPLFAVCVGVLTHVLVLTKVVVYIGIVAIVTDHACDV